MPCTTAATPVIEPIRVAHVGVSVLRLNTASATAKMMTTPRPIQITNRFGSHTYPPLLPPLTGAWSALAQITKPNMNPRPHHTAIELDCFRNSKKSEVSSADRRPKLAPRTADTSIKQPPAIDRADFVAPVTLPAIPATAPAKHAATTRDENGMSSRRGFVRVVIERLSITSPTTIRTACVEAALSIKSRAVVRKPFNPLLCEPC